MIRSMILVTTLLAAMARPALADPIEGRWKTRSGNTAEIAACGGAFCVTLRSGPHAGKEVGRFNARAAAAVRDRHRSEERQDLQGAKAISKATSSS